MYLSNSYYDIYISYCVHIFSDVKSKPTLSWSGWTCHDPNKRKKENLGPKKNKCLNKIKTKKKYKNIRKKANNNKVFSVFNLRTYYYPSRIITNVFLFYQSVTIKESGHLQNGFFLTRLPRTIIYSMYCIQYREGQGRLCLHSSYTIPFDWSTLYEGNSFCWQEFFNNFYHLSVFLLLK